MSFSMTTIRGHSFFPKGLGPGSTIVDLGGNRGEFSQAIVERFGCRCLIVEASPSMAAAIPVKERIHVVNCAISSLDGEIDFFLAENCESSTIRANEGTESGKKVKIAARTLASLMRERSIEHIDLLKIDIEGAERELFESIDDNALEVIDQLTIEFHDFLGLISRAEVEAMVARLVACGFSAVKLTRTNKNWAFVRADRLKLGAMELMHARTIFRAREVASTLYRRLVGSSAAN